MNLKIKPKLYMKMGQAKGKAPGKMENNLLESEKSNVNFI